MARKKKVVYREPNPHDVAMWKKVEVMRHLTFEENMVEIAAVVFNRPGLGGLRLESSTLVTSKGAEVLPKTPFEVDYL